ncbi:MAG: metal-dependent phosphohydrolase, partial [Deltaproteobacteria bacterium]
MTEQNHFFIDDLISIVQNGGAIKTGVDIYNNDGLLLLDKNILVQKTNILEIIKKNGITTIPVTDAAGGCWDEMGNVIRPSQEETPEDQDNTTDDIDIHNASFFPDVNINEMEKRLLKISDIKKQAREKYNNAKNCIQKTFQDIQENQGQFDYTKIESTVDDMIEFIENKENSFSYLTREIFSYNEYLYNHSINVCSIGYTMLTQFNSHFSKFIDHLIQVNDSDIYNPFEKGDISTKQSYNCYYPNEIKDICIGFFLHDIGKVLIPDAILNKEGKLTPKEYEKIQKHSYEYGPALLKKNQINNSIIEHIIRYHHSELFGNESNCYPDKSYLTIPPYTKICKLADMYDAMTSKRSYKEAVNPINVVTQLFRNYAKKDQILQFILHAFVKGIG